MNCINKKKINSLTGKQVKNKNQAIHKISTKANKYEMRGVFTDQLSFRQLSSPLLGKGIDVSSMTSESTVVFHCVPPVPRVVLGYNNY